MSGWDQIEAAEALGRWKDCWTGKKPSDREQALFVSWLRRFPLRVVLDALDDLTVYREKTTRPEIGRVIQRCNEMLEQDRSRQPGEDSPGEAQGEILEARAYLARLEARAERGEALPGGIPAEELPAAVAYLRRAIGG